MMRYWDIIQESKKDGFDIIVDKSWEDCHPRDLFDDSCYDIEDMCRKIDRGDLDWFMLRVRAMVDGHEMGSTIVGGFLYEDPREVLKDGVVTDMIDEALDEARREAQALKQRLEELV